MSPLFECDRFAPFFRSGAIDQSHVRLAYRKCRQSAVRVPVSNSIGGLPMGTTFIGRTQYLSIADT